MTWRIFSKELPNLFSITELVSSQIEFLVVLANTRFHIFDHYCMATPKVFFLG